MVNSISQEIMKCILPPMVLHGLHLMFLLKLEPMMLLMVRIQTEKLFGSPWVIEIVLPTVMTRYPGTELERLYLLLVRV